MDSSHSVILKDGKSATSEDKEHGEEEDDANEDVAGPAPKRRKPTPLPQDVKRTEDGAKHMPELVPSSTVRHRFRFPGCQSTNARFFCSNCKVYLCITQARNCYKIFHMSCK
uniref:Uncharacterized protein n=1 Tax=Homalodisca liturata TaxID=320908 RepID=A0A1B6JN86_9HEMI